MKHEVDSQEDACAERDWYELARYNAERIYY
jgi:hypothetical protein